MKGKEFFFLLNINNLVRYAKTNNLIYNMVDSSVAVFLYL